MQQTERSKEEQRKQVVQTKQGPEVREAIKELRSAPLILPGYEDLTSKQSEIVWDRGW